MKNRMISIFIILLLSILAGTLLASCGSGNSPGSTATIGSTSSGSSSDGQALMQARCSVCHSTDRITSSHKTAEQWKSTVDRMINNGAQLTSQEEQTLVDYLSQTYK